MPFQDARVAQKRVNFGRGLSRISCNEVICIDETAIQFDMMPRYGYAPRTKRLGMQHKAYCKRFSIIAAVTSSTVLAWTIVKGSVNSDIFSAFIRSLPSLTAKYVMCDNVSFHKTKISTNAMREKGPSRGAGGADLLDGRKVIVLCGAEGEGGLVHGHAVAPPFVSIGSVMLTYFRRDALSHSSVLSCRILLEDFHYFRHDRCAIYSALQPIVRPSKRRLRRPSQPERCRLGRGPRRRCTTQAIDAPFSKSLLT